MKDKLIAKSINDIKEWCELYKGSPVLSLDLETSGLSFKTDKIVGYALSCQENTGIYIPVGHTKVKDNVKHDLVLPYIADLVDSVDLVVIYNAKFDTRFLQKYGLDIPTDKVKDVWLQVFVVGEPYAAFNLGSGLKDQVKYYYNHQMTEFNDLFPVKRKVKNCAVLPAITVGEYAIEDADYTLRLHNKLYPKVVNKIYYQLEESLWPIAREIERNGFKANVDHFYAEASKLRDRQKELAKEIAKMFRDAGIRHPVNIDSPAVLADVLYSPDKMGIPVQVKTKKDKASTDKKALIMLKDEYPIADKILDYRALTKAISSLEKTLPDSVDPESGRIYTEYNQIGATTGRFSSSGPNLQNVAKGATLAGVDVVTRDGFIAEDDYYLMELDYKQIEMICLAYVAKERKILDTYYSEEGDLHSLTASFVYGGDPADVTKKQRNNAKMFNYLIVYGGTGYGMAQRSELSLEEADRVVELLKEAYPHIQIYDEKLRKQVVKGEGSALNQRGFVKSWLGRKMFLPSVVRKLNMNSSAYVDNDLRSAVNRYCQGSAAEIQKIGLIKTYKAAIRHFGDSVKMVAQTHDSQTWEIPKSIAPDDAFEILAKTMEVDLMNWSRNHPHPIIKVDCQLGLSWGALMDYEPGVTYEDLLNNAESQSEKQVYEETAIKIDVSDFDATLVAMLEELYPGEHELVSSDTIVGKTSLTQDEIYDMISASV